MANISRRNLLKGAGALAGGGTLGALAGKKSSSRWLQFEGFGDDLPVGRDFPFPVGVPNIQMKPVPLYITPELSQLMSRYNVEHTNQKLIAMLGGSTFDRAALQNELATLRQQIRHDVRQPPDPRAIIAVTNHMLGATISAAIITGNEDAIDILKSSFGEFDKETKTQPLIAFLSDCYRKQALEAANGTEYHFPDCGTLRSPHLSPTPHERVPGSHSTGGQGIAG